MGLLVRSFNYSLYKCFSGNSDVQGAVPGLKAPVGNGPPLSPSSRCQGGGRGKTSSEH